MATTGVDHGAADQTTFKAEYNRLSELKAFDESKAGVKGLVDAGITEIPRFFHYPPDSSEPIFSSVSGDTQLSIPVIDLKGVLDGDRDHRQEIVEKVREATETWGFFQVVNHGIPDSVLEEIKDGVRRFYEQDVEIKKAFYTRDTSKPMVHNSNFDLYNAPSANWRDTFFCPMFPNPPKPEDLPAVCRCLYLYIVYNLDPV
ncbi:Non-heme dioxygenase N-terminal domain containing protein [Trema orientale]|uniref:Non-heme dioxygenase N-terminal domain containing protein n=1 Tax=Trema orientale TaxID=63057 RepID=A0A2P5AWS5_TREOI|nr:Non-heme dioxygenase N-terminal domain containing protein [Trema orientale]